MRVQRTWNTVVAQEGSEMPGRHRFRIHGSFWKKLGAESIKDLKEGAFSLILCNVGDYISGVFMTVFQPILKRAPILLALLPAADDSRGDVYSSYGSRLGTLLHLGSAKRLMREELTSLFTILFCISFWVGFSTFTVFLLIKRIAYPWEVLISTAITSALLSSIFMIPATTWLAFISYRKGWDPDNMVAPIATLFGDMVTIPTIIAAYEFTSRAPRLPLKAGVIIFFLISLGMIAWISYLHKKGGMERAFKVIRENIPVIMLSTSMSLMAGVILYANQGNIFSAPGILSVIPAFLEDGGAIACRFSARLSTSLHLGKIEARWIPKQRWVFEQFLINMIHASIIFTSLGFLGFLMASFQGAALAWRFKVILIVLIAGYILSAVVSFLTYFLAVLSYRFGIDPDNVLAPVLTSLADMIGSSSLSMILRIFI